MRKIDLWWLFTEAYYKNKADNHCWLPAVIMLGRDEATRTPDPYVPNVVRYQLRYIPIAVQR